MNYWMVYAILLCYLEIELCHETSNLMTHIVPDYTFMNHLCRQIIEIRLMCFICYVLKTKESALQCAKMNLLLLLYI